MSPWAAAIVIIAINTSMGSKAEIWGLRSWIFRAGNSTPHTRGADAVLSFRRIVFPQVWRASLPALVNEMNPGHQGQPGRGPSSGSST
jgi:ABC-type arginine transport system permease subunit